MIKWKKYYIISIIFIFVIIYFYIKHNTNDEFNSEIHFLELPIGDCTLIKTSERNILLGTAYKKDSKYISKYLEKYEIDNVSDLILVYPNKDNIEGFYSLLPQINNIYIPYIENLESSIEFFTDAKKYNIPIYKIEDNEKWEVDNLEFIFLRPLKDSTIPEDKKKIVLKLEYGKESILWLPPMEQMDKSDLMLSARELKSTILKISGEKRDIFMDKDFLSYVDPSIILFTDREKPKEEELRLIYGWNSKVQLFSTYEEGDIIVYTQDKKYNIITNRMMEIRIQ
ncbi:ComEC/Rec2 family competence protein [Defluviitalea phaphyphila]|uniref:hypothetical protein n=1 Tax=Defluviitalea phaphyphila TaxID=1473580 RepID=UPI00072FA793|nr:hypothetical protein [Defluviitalea phaphyphila]